MSAVCEIGAIWGKVLYKPAAPDIKPQWHCQIGPCEIPRLGATTKWHLVVWHIVVKSEKNTHSYHYKGPDNEMSLRLDFIFSRPKRKNVASRFIPNRNVYGVWNCPEQIRIWPSRQIKLSGDDKYALKSKQRPDFLTTCIKLCGQKLSDWVIVAWSKLEHWPRPGLG